MAHHDHEVEYPNQFPSTCIASAISIIRGGASSITSQRQVLGLDAYNIGGYAARVFLGMPEGPHAAVAPPADEELATAQCRDLCEAVASAQGGGNFSSENFVARDWRLLLRWFLENIAPLLLPLILEEQT